jgi:uncharacterized glyoxalase superfamily protein PhnB
MVMAKAKKKNTTARPRVSTIPKGYHSITPVLIVKGAEQAIEFYKKAFGDKELHRAYMPAAGATVTMPLIDAFWGDRTGQLVDPYGHVWSFATRKRNLSQKETQEALQQ